MAFTFFFRDEQTLRLAAEHLVPTILGRSRIHVWDAGCAMGPEPYTLAMILAETMGRYAFRNLFILATDYNENENFGGIIEQAEYPEADLARIPDEIRRSYFEPGSTPGTLRVVSEVRDRVRFTRHDLLTLRSPASGFSLILCKNVLLHFSAAQRVEVIRMFHEALAPEGFLAMEQTQKMPEECAGLFHRVVADAQLYRKIG